MILTAQVGAGIYFAVNYDDMMEKGLTESLRGAKYTSLYSFWTELQKDLRCCGVNGPTDWEKIANLTKLPTSCCSTANVECTIDEATTAGCKEKMVQVWLDNKNWIGAIFGLVAAFEVGLLKHFYSYCNVSPGILKKIPILYFIIVLVAIFVNDIFGPSFSFCCCFCFQCWSKCPYV